MPADKEFRRFYVQLFGDIVTDVAELAAALPAGAICGFMPVFNTR